MNNFKCTLVMIVTILFSFATQAKDICVEQKRGLNAGLVQLSTYDANFLAPQSICHSKQLRLETSLRVTYEPEKYGFDPIIQVLSGAPLHLVASTQIAGSYIVTKGWELSASIEIPRFQYIISGYQSQYLGLGDMSLASNFHIIRRQSLLVAMATRLVLPSAITYYRNAYPIHLELGILARYQALPFLFFNGSLNTGASTALSAAKVRSRAGLQTIIGAELRFLKWIDFALDLRVLNLYEYSLDSLDLAFALRTHLFAGLGAEWQTVIPVAGRDRNLFQTRFSLLYHF